AVAGEDLDVHDGAFDARRTVERGVAHVAGFLAEDGAQQFFFRSERGLALGRDLADENVARLDDRADADDAAFVEVAQERFADVGNVARDFLGTELRVAGFDFVLLDVDRSVVVVLYQLFADEDGVFEVVSAPRQEGHEHVASQGQFEDAILDRKSTRLNSSHQISSYAVFCLKKKRKLRRKKKDTT